MTMTKYSDEDLQKLREIQEALKKRKTVYARVNANLVPSEEVEIRFVVDQRYVIMKPKDGGLQTSKYLSDFFKNLKEYKIED